MPDEFQQPMQQDPVSALLAEFGTRLNEIEEKQRLIKDRVLLIGENLISTKEDAEKESLVTREKIKQIEQELKTLKQLTKRIVGELDNFSRKTEFEILQRQMKMFSPLKFTTPEDVKKIIHEQSSKKE